MVLSRATVTRPLVLLEPDDHGVLRTVDLTATLALARCTRCKTRPRVLPCDALPRKPYGLAVIEHRMSEYARGDRSLRQVAWSQLGERTPTHTTLHAWTEGLGAYALDRGRGRVGGAPMSRFVADADARVPGVAASMRKDVAVNPKRYRSQPRRERLAAVIRTLSLARAVASKPHPGALAECRRLALAWSRSSAFEFRTGLSCTSIEHRDRSESPRSRSACPKSRLRGPVRTRSPPGASSRSHP
jgi:hypothetical protein